MLTTAHRDHVPEHCDETNLFAACQKCHLAYDSGHHRETRARTRQARATAGMEPLPGPWPGLASTGAHGGVRGDLDGDEYAAAIEARAER